MLPPLTERLVDTIAQSLWMLDQLPGNNPDRPDWTRLDSVLKVTIGRWAIEEEQ